MEEEQGELLQKLYIRIHSYNTKEGQCFRIILHDDHSTYNVGKLPKRNLMEVKKICSDAIDRLSDFSKKHLQYEQEKNSFLKDLTLLENNSSPKIFENDHEKDEYDKKK